MTYFFSGTKVYAFDDIRIQVMRGFPRNAPSYWLPECNTDDNEIGNLRLPNNPARHVKRTTPGTTKKIQFPQTKRKSKNYLFFRPSKRVVSKDVYISFPDERKLLRNLEEPYCGRGKFSIQRKYENMELFHSSLRGPIYLHVAVEWRTCRNNFF